MEGLADLVAAETQGQRRQAFRQMKGLLGSRAETWRQRLIQALALVEARIDFSDEADVPEICWRRRLAIARELETEIAAALADGGRGERLREGLVVAIAGPPKRRQVHAAQSDRAARGGDRVALCRDHARRDRGASRPCRAGR